MVKNKNSGKWTKEETIRLFKALECNSRWDDISEIVGTRTPDQCRSHNQKLMLQYKKMGKSYFNGYKSLKIDKATQYEISEFSASYCKSINRFNDNNRIIQEPASIDTKKDTFITDNDTKKDTFSPDFYSGDFIVGINESVDIYY